MPKPTGQDTPPAPTKETSSNIVYAQTQLLQEIGSHSLMHGSCQCEAAPRHAASLEHKSLSLIRLRSCMNRCFIAVGLLSPSQSRILNRTSSQVETAGRRFKRSPPKPCPLLS